MSRSALTTASADTVLPLHNSLILLLEATSFPSPCNRKVFSLHTISNEEHASLIVQRKQHIHFSWFTLDDSTAVRATVAHSPIKQGKEAAMQVECFHIR